MGAYRPTRKPKKKQPLDDPILQNRNTEAEHDPGSMNTVLHLQRTIGNKAVQRLMNYKEYKKATKAPGKRSHIRPIDQAYKLFLQHAPTIPNGLKIKKMQELIHLTDVYLADPKRQKSKRRAGVINLKGELQGEINDLKSELGENDFTDENMTADHGQLGSGQMNTVDLYEYGFGIMQELDDEGVAHDVKVEGDSFEGVFKPDTESFENLGSTRAGWTGIQADDLRFSERSVATYELAKLFDASIIPPTFFAKHQKDGEEITGTVMEKVKGFEAQKEFQTSDLPAEGMQYNNEETRNKWIDGVSTPVISAHNLYKNDPAYREGVSKLMMFDAITGQVDRHRGNYMIEVDDAGKITGIKGIDNDLAFGDDYVDHTYAKAEERERGIDYSQHLGIVGGRVAGTVIQDLNEIDQKLAERIIAVSQRPELVQNALEGLLTDAEIQATLSRLSSLADFLRPLLTNNDERIVSKWE